MAEVGLNYSIDEDGIVRLQKDLNYLLTHLDHQNVRTLYTEFCDIRSELGETVIDGPALKMYDSSGILRLFMGLDSTSVSPTTATSDFVFNLYDANGIRQISLNSSGEAVFGGNIQTMQDAYFGRFVFIGSTIQPLVSSNSPTDLSGIKFIEHGTSNVVAFLGTSAGESVLALDVYYGFDLWAIDGVISLWSMGANSTSYLRLDASNNRIRINSDGWNSSNSSDAGVTIGTEYKETYLCISKSSNKVATEGYQRRNNIEKGLTYLCGKNTKVLYFGSTVVAVPSTSVTSIYQAGNRFVNRNVSLHMVSATRTTGSYVEAVATIANVDLTAFNDNSAATTDDFIVFVFYVQSTAHINNTHGVYFYPGQSTAAYFRYRNCSTYGYDITTGWNIIARKIGSYDSVLGAPSFANIASMTMGWRTATTNSTGFGVSFDYVGIHRKHFSLSTTWEDLQAEKNSTYTNYWYSGFDKFMIVDYTSDIGLVNLTPWPNDNSIQFTTNLYSNFSAELEFICNNAGKGPCLFWSDLANNHAKVSISSNVLTLETNVNSTVNTYQTNLPTLSFGDKVKLYISKDYESYINVTYIANSTVNTIRSLYINSSHTRSLYGEIYFGSVESSGTYILTKLKYNGYE